MAPGASAPLVLLLALSAPAAAIAQPAPPSPRARLVYFVAPDAEACPSADEFRAAVNARAGHDLFGEPANVTLEVTLGRAGAAHVATVDLPDAPAGRGATRELRSDVGCAELATAAALVASIALDPASLLEPPAAAPPPPPPEPRTWRGLVGLGPRAAWGLTPGATAGLALSAAVLRGRGAFGVELRGLLPRDATYGSGSVTIVPLTMSLLPCVRRGPWEACGVALLGLVRGAGSGFTENYAAWKAMAGLGARGGAGVELGRFRLGAFLEGVVILPRTTFLVGTGAAYTTRGVSVGGGLDALLLF